MRRLPGILMLALLLLSGCMARPAAGEKDPRVQKAQERLPFKLVLPAKLPPGYELASISVDASRPVGNLVKANLIYRTAAGADLQITESNLPAHPAEPGVEAVKIGGVGGEYQEIRRPDGTTVRSVAFPPSDAVWVTMISLSLSRTELLQVAASMAK